MPRVVRKQNPPAVLDYRKYKRFLRVDFEYRCAYCHIPEIRNGSSRNFAVEHFRPKSKLEFAHLKCVYSNLYYACFACNDFKGSRWPAALEEAGGFRFLDPCVDDFIEHLDVAADGSMLPLTPGGSYTSAHLNLNREFLREWRAEKRQLRRRIEYLRLRIDELTAALVDWQSATPVPRGSSRLASEVLKTIAAMKKNFAALESRMTSEFGDWWRG